MAAACASTGAGVVAGPDNAAAALRSVLEGDCASRARELSREIRDAPGAEDVVQFVEGGIGKSAGS
jgi:hypothetical protein